MCARITAIETETGVHYVPEFGEVTEVRKQSIAKSMENGDSHGYNLRTIEHRYFFVEKFYETDFKKITPGGSMGTRIFDLPQLLGTDDIPETEQVAKLLAEKSWS